MIPARCSPRSRSTSVMGIRASRPMGMAAILPSLTHRRTVSGCNPRRLATSPDRSNLVFSVLITRIDYQIYVNLSTVVHPCLLSLELKENRMEQDFQEQACWLLLTYESGLSTRIINEVVVPWCHQLRPTLRSFFNPHPQTWSDTCHLSTALVENLSRPAQSLRAWCCL